MNREVEEEPVMTGEAKTEDNEVGVLVKGENKDDEAVGPVEAEIGSTILNMLLENAGRGSPGFNMAKKRKRTCSIYLI